MEVRDLAMQSFTELGGYSIVSADDLSAAVAIARSCPALSAGGGVEVGELTRLGA